MSIGDWGLAVLLRKPPDATPQPKTPDVGEVRQQQLDDGRVAFTFEGAHAWQRSVGARAQCPRQPCTRVDVRARCDVLTFLNCIEWSVEFVHKVMIFIPLSSRTACLSMKCVFRQKPCLSNAFVLLFSVVMQSHNVGRPYALWQPLSKFTNMVALKQWWTYRCVSQPRLHLFPPPSLFDLLSFDPSPRHNCSSPLQDGEGSSSSSRGTLPVQRGHSRR